MQPYRITHNFATQGCLTDEQVSELEREGLMDCSQVSHNPTGIPPRAASVCTCKSLQVPLFGRSQTSDTPIFHTVYDPPAPSKGNMCQSSCSVGGELNYVGTIYNIHLPT